MMIGYLVRCALRTKKISLLPDNFMEGQDVLLRTFGDGLFEIHPDPSQALRMVEEQPDCLLSGPCRLPPRSSIGQQRMLNRVNGPCDVISTSTRPSTFIHSWSKKGNFCEVG